MQHCSLRTHAVSVQVVVSDARGTAVVSLTRPRSTQPAALILCSRRIPVDSSTLAVVEARCLTGFKSWCIVTLTVGDVRVRLWHPLSAVRYKRTDHLSRLLLLSSAHATFPDVAKWSIWHQYKTGRWNPLSWADLFSQPLIRLHCQ